MKIGPVIFLAILAAGVALPLAVRHNARTELSAKNETLSRQAEELERLTAENGRLSNSAAAGNNPSGLSAEEHDELLKLRGEIGRLRQQTNDLEKVREQNARLSQQAAAAKNFQPVTVARAAFANAGWATPEAALQTFMWGLSSGNREAIFRSLTGEAADSLGKQLVGASEEQFSAMTAEFSQHVTGYQILGEYPAADGAVVLTVSPQGLGDSQKSAMTVKKVDGEWKLSYMNMH